MGPFDFTANAKYVPDTQPRDPHGVSEVERIAKPPFATTRSRKQCVREGLEFEAIGQRNFEAQLRRGQKQIRNPWFRFRTPEGKLSHASPDSLLLLGDWTLVILEFKLRHTNRSAFQLLKYAELMKHIYPEREIHLIEVYKYWDWVRYPAPSMKVQDLGEALSFPSGTIKLLQLTED